MPSPISFFVCKEMFKPRPMFLTELLPRRGGRAGPLRAPISRLDNPRGIPGNTPYFPSSSRVPHRSPRSRSSLTTHWLQMRSPVDHRPKVPSLSILVPGLQPFRTVVAVAVVVVVVAVAVAAEVVPEAVSEAASEAAAEV